jgi:hypothetical protein
MSVVVNLRQARKRKRRAEKEEAAEANRVTHGRPAAEKTATARAQALQARRLEGHRREPGSQD